VDVDAGPRSGSTSRAARQCGNPQFCQMLSVEQLGHPSNENPPPEEPPFAPVCVQLQVAAGHEQSAVYVNPSLHVSVAPIEQPLLLPPPVDSPGVHVIPVPASCWV
jgi:hypothetical protein